MKTVWKFPLQVTKLTVVEAPADAPVRLAALDPASGAPAVWLEVDTEAPRVERRFRIHGTGHEVDEDEQHVGSMADRSFVWHVYERRA